MGKRLRTELHFGGRSENGSGSKSGSGSGSGIGIGSRSGSGSGSGSGGSITQIDRFRIGALSEGEFHDAKVIKVLFKKEVGYEKMNYPFVN